MREMKALNYPGEELQTCTFTTPFGLLCLCGHAGRIDAVQLNVDPAAGCKPLNVRHVDEATRRTFLEAEQQIGEFFAGQRRTFELPLNVSSLSRFTQQVLQILQTQVPFATTTTYAQLAQRAGSPGAARAVGGVMARNPFPLIVPCHRVLGRNGALTGFSARGGLSLKQQLLEFEARMLADH